MRLPADPHPRSPRARASSDGQPQDRGRRVRGATFPRQDEQGPPLPAAVEPLNAPPRQRLQNMAGFGEMRIPTLYLDTSVLGGYFDDEWKQPTQELWRQMENGVDLWKTRQRPLTRWRNPASGGRPQAASWTRCRQSNAWHTFGGLVNATRRSEPRADPDGISQPLLPPSRQPGSTPPPQGALIAFPPVAVRPRAAICRATFPSQLASLAGRA